MVEEYAPRLKLLHGPFGAMDVLLAGENQCPVEFYGRMGGVVPYPDEVLDEIKRVAKGNLDTQGHPRDRWLKRMQRNK